MPNEKQVRSMLIRAANTPSPLLFWEQIITSFKHTSAGKGDKGEETRSAEDTTLAMRVYLKLQGQGLVEELTRLSTASRAENSISEVMG